MPKSKRDKKISLTKTDKKRLVLKQQIIEDIQSCCNKYNNIFLFSVENMRNSKLKEVRTEWKHSRFFFGKNRVMQLGLRGVIENNGDDSTGIDSDSTTTSVAKSLNELCDRLTGQCGLLFTNKTRQEVLDWFENYCEVDYARAGFCATETVTLPAAQMPEFSHAIEPHLRSLGMPTKLEKGIVALYKEYTVCKEGQILSPEQAKILKLILKPIAEFKLCIECCWIKDGGFEMMRDTKVKRSLSDGSEKLKKKEKRKHKKTDEMETKVSVEEEQEDSEGEDDEDVEMEDESDSS